MEAESQWAPGDIWILPARVIAVRLLGSKSRNSGLTTGADSAFASGTNHGLRGPVASIFPPARRNLSSSWRSSALGKFEGAAKTRTVERESAGRSAGGRSQRSALYPASSKSRKAALAPEDAGEYVLGTPESFSSLLDCHARAAMIRRTIRPVQKSRRRSLFSRAIGIPVSRAVPECPENRFLQRCGGRTR